MKIGSSPRELAGYYQARQVLGQSRKDLVFSAEDEEQGSDKDALSHWRSGASSTIDIQV
jgi:hypothetical protein